MTGFFVSFGKYISFCIFVIPNSSYLPTIPIEQENWTPEVAIFAVSTYVITLVNFHVQVTTRRQNKLLDDSTAIPYREITG